MDKLVIAMYRLRPIQQSANFSVVTVAIAYIIVHDDIFAQSHACISHAHVYELGQTCVAPMTDHPEGK